jgi:hypothetical protein
LLAPPPDPFLGEDDADPPPLLEGEFNDVVCVDQNSLRNVKYSLYAEELYALSGSLTGVSFGSKPMDRFFLGESFDPDDTFISAGEGMRFDTEEWFIYYLHQYCVNHS